MPWPVPGAASTAAIAAAVPWTTRGCTLTTRRCAYCLTTWPSRKPAASTSRGRPRRPGETGGRHTRRPARAGAGQAVDTDEQGEPAGAGADLLHQAGEQDPIPLRA